MNPASEYQHPLLRAECLCVVRGGRALLDDISCDFHRGRLTVIAGPNGAGKSTLLRALSGELVPNSGRTFFDQRPLADWKPRDLALRRAVLPQESPLNFPFRVREVVLLGRSPHLAGRAENKRDREIVREVLEQVDLGHTADRVYPTLSGGEKQRVHLARVLAQLQDSPPDDSLLFLDEPTASLDPAHQHAVLKIARELADRGTAVVAVLHDLNLTLAYADELLVLKDGRVAAAGPVRKTLTASLIENVFGLPAQLINAPDHPRGVLVFGRL